MPPPSLVSRQPPRWSHFCVDSLRELEVAVGLGGVLFLERGGLADLGGQEHRRADRHRLAQHAVGVEVVEVVDLGPGRRGAGPAEEAVRLLHRTLDPGVGPVHQHRRPLGIPRGHVAVVEAVREGRHQPGDVLAHGLVAIAVAGVADDVLLPARRASR